MNRIAIFNPNPDGSTNPTLVSLLAQLERDQIQVDLYAPESKRFEVAQGSHRQLPFPGLWKGSSYRSRLRRWIRRSWDIPSRMISSNRHYDLVIGVDSRGVIAGFQYSRRFGTPLVYLSFEICFRDELRKSADLDEKEQECLASRHASLVITQDRSRAQLLCAENGIEMNRIELLPVAPKGPVEETRSDLLRSRLSIPENKSIVIHSGSFSPWTCSNELMENVNNWPDEFVLVIHTRFHPGQKDSAIAALQSDRPRKVFLSTQPVCQEEYEKLLTSADIGLVLYKKVKGSKLTQRNIESIGLASGKLADYMKCGLPAVSVGLSSLAELQEEFQFGTNVHSFEELPDALRRVLQDRVRYASGAKRFFSEKLDFNVHWPRLVSRLKETVG